MRSRQSLDGLVQVKMQRAIPILSKRLGQRAGAQVTQFQSSAKCFASNTSPGAAVAAEPKKPKHPVLDWQEWRQSVDKKMADSKHEALMMQLKVADLRAFRENVKTG